LNVNMSRRAALKAAGVGAASLVVGAGVGQGTALASRPRRADAVAALRNALGSKVLFPGDPDYDNERAAFNTLIQQSPLAIVLAQTPQDVATAIRIGGSELGWPVAVQATGHGICVPADQALLINLREMNGVTIDTAAGTARISGGAKWKDVITAAAPLGLLPPVGSTSDVGATGYVTGGGVPIVGRTYGFAADKVRRIEMVTPDGRYRCLSPDERSELFWAVRGGGSNFGAVTSFEIDLIPASTVYGGALVFSAATSAQAFQAYVDWTATVSDQMTAVASFIRRPNAPQVLSIEIVYLGSATDGASQLAPLRALNPVSDTVAEVPNSQLDSIFRVPTTPGATVSASGLFGQLDANGVNTVLSAIGFGATLPSGVVEVRQLGGAFAGPPVAPNAIGNRDASFLLFLSNPAPQPQLVPSIEQAQQNALTQLAPVLTGGRVPTFLGTLDTSPDAVKSAYGQDNWDRLLQLKHQYDPANLFRFNHNIQ
jgi:FAD/FMN-containing dehydrogenase